MDVQPFYDAIDIAIKLGTGKYLKKLTNSFIFRN